MIILVTISVRKPIFPFLASQNIFRIERSIFSISVQYPTFHFNIKALPSLGQKVMSERNVLEKSRANSFSQLLGIWSTKSAAKTNDREECPQSQ